jgi:hypothetical protein
MAGKKAVKKKDSTPVFASEENLRDVKNEIRELESMLREDEARGDKRKIQDVMQVKAEILKKQQYIERHSPSKLRGEAANKAYKEARELEKVIQENMPKANDYYQRQPKNSDSYSRQQDFEAAVRQQIHFQSNPELKRAQMKYKAIMAQLDPQNPTVRNLERLRK